MSSYSAAGVHVTVIWASEATVRPAMRFEPWLTQQARRVPERVALESGDEVLSYAQLHSRAADAAAGLRARGVRAGDRVTITRPPGVGFAVALHACLLAGAVAVPLDPRLTDAERAERA